MRSEGVGFVPAPSVASVKSRLTKEGSMVVEYLTFQVDAARRADWLDVEERTWSRFLEAQPGFIRKQMWTERGDDDHVHAAIWWETEADWLAIDPDQLAAVDAAMGELCVLGRLRTFDVIRDC
jgi:uncharacterized protein (TIGR03792 family)